MRFSSVDCLWIILISNPLCQHVETLFIIIVIIYSFIAFGFSATSDSINVKSSCWLAVDYLLWIDKCVEMTKKAVKNITGFNF